MYTAENIEQMRDYIIELLEVYEEIAPEAYYKSSLVTEIDELFKEIDGEA